MATGPVGWTPAPPADPAVIKELTARVAALILMVDGVTNENSDLKAQLVSLNQRLDQFILEDEKLRLENAELRERIELLHDD